jgi:hypothetical protein
MAAAEVLQNHSRAPVHQQHNVFDNLLLLLLLFGQDQQDIPITGQPSKRQSKKKETKRSNHQTVIKNLQNYTNPYQATSILLQFSNERVEIAPLNSIDVTTKYVHHILNVLIIDHHPDDRRRESSICTSGRKKESVFRATSCFHEF